MGDDPGAGGPVETMYTASESQATSNFAQWGSRHRSDGLVGHGSPQKSGLDQLPSMGIVSCRDRAPSTRPRPTVISGTSDTGQMQASARAATAIRSSAVVYRMPACLCLYASSVLSVLSVVVVYRHVNHG